MMLKIKNNYQFYHLSSARIVIFGTFYQNMLMLQYNQLIISTYDIELPWSNFFCFGTIFKNVG